MKTLVTFVERTVPKKHTLFRSILKFMLIVRTKMRPTRTAEHFEEGVIWSFIKQHFEWRLHVKASCGNPVYQKTGSNKSIAPEPKRDRGMCKKCQASFNYVTVLALTCTVLLMCMRTRHMV